MLYDNKTKIQVSLFWSRRKTSGIWSSFRGRELPSKFALQSGTVEGHPIESSGCCCETFFEVCLTKMDRDFTENISVYSLLLTRKWRYTTISHVHSILCWVKWGVAHSVRLSKPIGKWVFQLRGDQKWRKESQLLLQNVMHTYFLVFSELRLFLRITSLKFFTDWS